MTDAHPVQLVVTDDLERGRLSVFFRLFATIPHLLWLALFAQVSFIVAFVGWWAALFTGRIPQGIHDFLSGYVRYVVHVNAYLFLAAQPWPKFFLGSGLEPYPIDVQIAPRERQHRLKTFFRLPLAYPASLFLGTLALASGARSVGGALAIGSVLAWFACLVRGRMPRGLRDLAAYVLGYGAQLASYLFLLTDRYPYAGPDFHLRSVEPPAPEGRPQVVASGEERRSRLLVFFRLPLAFPHFVWLILWTVVVWLVVPLNWIATIVRGRAPRPFARFLAAYLRYTTHFWGFFTLVANPFPGFVGRAGSYPVDLEIDPFGRQSRWVSGFRLFLALPALWLATAAAGLLAAVAFLSWFVGLFLGRAPRGLRNAGAFALGYTAQVGAYAYLLGDRYPMSSPIGTWREA